MLSMGSCAPACAARACRHASLQACSKLKLWPASAAEPRLSPLAGPRSVTIAGICPRGYRDCGVQEAAKINQGRGIWVENSEIYNGWNAAFDCTACQVGRAGRRASCRQTS